MNKHALCCPKNPENADKVAAAGALVAAAGALVAGEASKIRVLLSSADAHALVLACNDNPLSDLTERLQQQQWERLGEEANDLERQAEQGLNFLRQHKLPCHNVLVIVQAVAQIEVGVENEAATNEAVVVLAQTAVLDANSDGKDLLAAAERCRKILAAKETLKLSKSPLPLHLALMFAILYKAGLVPCFCEFVGPRTSFELGLQPNGKTSHACILKDTNVASLPEVQNFVLVSGIQQSDLFNTITDLFVDLIAPNGDRLAPDANFPAGAIFCTMFDSYAGQVLGALEGGWNQKHSMLTGAAELLDDPTGTNVPQVVAKTLHFSQTHWRHMNALARSLFNQVKAKAPDGLKQRLVMPTDLELVAIDKAFRFPGLFDQSIRDAMKGMPQNAKKSTLKTLKQEGLGKQLWIDYQAAGLSAVQFSSHISRILTKDTRKKERAEARAAAVPGSHAGADCEHGESSDSDDE
jgi:hypothetical protein